MENGRIGIMEKGVGNSPSSSLERKRSADISAYVQPPMKKTSVVFVSSIDEWMDEFPDSPEEAEWGQNPIQEINGEKLLNLWKFYMKI